MTSVLSDNLEQVVAEGSGMLRVTGEMPWPGALLQPHGADEFFVYEAALNDVVDRKPAIFMCLYELQRFGLDMLVAVLKTHPVVLLDRTVLVNPHFLTRRSTTLRWQTPRTGVPWALPPRPTAGRTSGPC